jgi:Fe-S cluster assembly ATPase SufC
LKKIDLHMHTVCTVWDTPFTFTLGALQRYVSEAALDAIAITNHNTFDRAQFAEIAASLHAAVLPGIEITLDCGHVLIVADVTYLDLFEEHTQQITERITDLGHSISVDELREVFSNLGEHIVIPHYDKKPAIKGKALESLMAFVSCGEVDSAKKFIRAIKSDTNVTPVLFSDARVCEALNPIPTRQTFVDCGELTFGALKACLSDKRKVALSENDGNSLFQVFDDGQKLSTGLNILLGERSTGKSYTLDRISQSHEHVKYIRQFSLVQQDDATYEREFSRDLQRTRSQFVENYLAGFKTVLDDVMGIDLRADDRAVEGYITSLLESAQEADRRDAFSNAALFDASEFAISDDKVLSDLIASVRQVIENVEYREIVEKYVDISALRKLAVVLIELLWEKRLESKKKNLVNDLVREIKESLKRRTAAVQVQYADLYRVMINKRKVERFSEIVKRLQDKATISEEAIQGFRVVATKAPFAGAGEIKDASGVKTAFKDAFGEYGDPYAYLQMLLANDVLARSELYKLFVKITYRILNRDGFEVSGGERSEFRLLQEIKDAHNYDILLIDEPESSFDNIFLRSDVNQIIREISTTMPVVVVTHNSTVGASIGANYLLYAKKSVEEGKVVYRLYSGHPTDLTLHSRDGRTISNHKVTLNSLEAGVETYDHRRQGYEAIKDRG